MKRIVLALSVALLVGACGPGTPSASPAQSLGPRPSSPATVAVLEPEQGSSVSGATIHVVLELIGGTIVPETTKTLRPDEGHVHLYVDNQLVSMNYGLEQDVPVTVGTHAIKAEFVAADHAPFNPRVWTTEIIFTVTG
jgi:hypothetical protein